MVPDSTSNPARRRQRWRPPEADAHGAAAAPHEPGPPLRPAALAGAAAAPGAAAEVGGDPLFAACRLVADRLDLPLERPAAAALGDPAALRLQRICDASRIFSRRVVLRGEWWRHDHGPLLAFLAEEEDAAGTAARGRSTRPVALLPTSATSYELVDATSGARLPVDGGLAARLDSAACMLYPSLAAGDRLLARSARLALRGRGRDLRTLLATAAAGGLLAWALPIATGLFYGRVIPRADGSLLGQLTLALLAATLGACAFQITRSLAVLRLGSAADAAAQPMLWARLLALPTSLLRSFSVGDLANRALGLETMRDLLLADATTALLALITAMLSLLLLFYYSWQLALLATALLATLAAATLLLARRELVHRRAEEQLRGRLSSLTFALIAGVAKLRTSHAEGRAYALWAGHLDRQRRRTAAARRIGNVQVAVAAVYAVAAELLLFALMGFVLRGRLGVGSFLAFSAAYGQVQAAALTFLSLLPGVLGVVPIAERLRPLLRAAPETGPARRVAGELAGDVEVDEAWFRYHRHAPPVLAELSLRARRGEFVAIVGPSGSGKSTTLRLLLGFERPERGAIRYDGRDLASLDLQSVRRQLGVVLQDSRPLAGDIYSHIVGNSHLGLDSAWEAARLAGIADDIAALPMGMHTVLGDGAATFSAGERQRLMIARALARRPRILLLDEATSALDNPTQEQIRRCLERLQTTRIVIAHRLSTIRHADRIYVLDAGRVVDAGTYDELARRGGVFAELVDRQLG